jgi:hypothetical protein
MVKDRHMHRVRSLFIQMDDNQLRRILATPMPSAPNLETLSLLREDFAPLVNAPDHLYISATPVLARLGYKLCYLQLQGFLLDWSLLSRFQLTALCIEYCRNHATTGYRWESFFDALSHLDALESLIIRQSLPTTPCITPSTRCTLPTLRKLHIRDGDLQCAAMLEHVSMPRTTYIQLSLQERVTDTEATRDALYRAVSGYLVARPLAFLQLVYFRNHLQYAGSDTVAGNVGLEIENAGNAYPLPAHRCTMEVLADAGCLRNVRSIYVKDGFFRGSYVQSADTMFAALSTVRELELDSGALYNLTRSEESRSPLATHLPLLESLSLLYTSVESLANMGRNVRRLCRDLRARILPVRRLRIEENIPAHEELIQRLREVVDEVSWELRGPGTPARDAEQYRGAEDDLGSDSHFSGDSGSDRDSDEDD